MEAVDQGVSLRSLLNALTAFLCPFTFFSSTPELAAEPLRPCPAAAEVFDFEAELLLLVVG